METTTAAHLDPGRRHDFVLLFDVQDGNPNGDPDAGNLPRVDPETMQGLVTDVSLKRRVRDWVDASCGSLQRYKIYVQRETYLTDQRSRVFADHGAGDKKDVRSVEARSWMCNEFFDIRMFGAVMSMKERNAGQVRGPLQLTFARSVEPVVPVDLSIARVALERGERSSEDGDELAAPTHGTLGRKALVPYGLYRGHGFYNPHFAEQTGADASDLELFWKALLMMWDLDRSASRGLMSCRGLFVFTHASKLGDAPAQSLFDRVRITRATEGAARSFTGYEVHVDEQGLPAEVTLTRLC